MNQYDFWPGPSGLSGYNAVYVKGGDEAVEPFVARAFDGCKKELFTVIFKERPLRQFSIFRCRNFKGAIETPRPERY
jgi:undecaprenyl-diphosphatase